MRQEVLRIPDIQDNNYGFDEVLNKLSFQKKIGIKNDIDLNNRVTLFEGDCMKMLKQMPDSSVSLIVTSPPYNIGKEYEKNQT